MRKLSILEYKDYRKFLSDTFLYRKEKLSGHYSHKQFASDMGLAASTYLFLVLQGKRNLSLEALEHIKDNLDFTNQQKKYFHKLVMLNQAKTKIERTRYQKQLEKILGKDRKVLSNDYDEYFGNWYIPVLREIVALKNFVSNLQWISKKIRPAINADQIKKAFQVLERLKMIRKQHGKWKLVDEHLITPDKVSSLNVFNYHKEMLSLSLKALDQPAKDREIVAMTLGISANQHEWLKEKIKTLVDEVQQELEEQQDHNTQVTQLNIQLFPVTES